MNAVFRKGWIIALPTMKKDETCWLRMSPKYHFGRGESQDRNMSNVELWQKIQIVEVANEIEYTLTGPEDRVAAALLLIDEGNRLIRNGYRLPSRAQYNRAMALVQQKKTILETYSEEIQEKFE